MKNEKYKDIMDQFTPNENTKERMLNKIMGEKNKTNSSVALGSRKIMVSLALLLVVVVMISVGTRSRSRVIYEGKDMKITAIGNAPEVQGDPSSITAIFTEDEVFTFFPIAAFRGQVLAIQNIGIEDEFGKSYSSFADIQVIESYQEDLVVGDKIKVLLPGPIEGGEIMGADFNITRAFRVGEEGIFLPVVNEDSSSSLYGFTKYSIIDTTRFAFIMTKEGLNYNKDTFSSLNDAKTLDDVEEFIKGKLVP